MNHSSALASNFDGLNIGGSKKNKGGDMGLFGGGVSGKNTMMEPPSFLASTLSNISGVGRKRDR